jgi:hypothetical protein
VVTTLILTAIEFLLDNKFNMDSLYRSGVPYISREEEEKAIAKAIERQNQTTASTSLDVKETDHESLAFLRVVRQLVDRWLALGDVCFILPPIYAHPPNHLDRSARSSSTFRPPLVESSRRGSAACHLY